MGKEENAEVFVSAGVGISNFIVDMIKVLFPIVVVTCFVNKYVSEESTNFVMINTFGNA